MERSEVETLVVINAARMSEGYFEIETTDKRIWANILKRVGGIEKLISVRTGAVNKARVPKEAIGRLVTFWWR